MIDPHVAAKLCAPSEVLVGGTVINDAQYLRSTAVHAYCTCTRSLLKTLVTSAISVGGPVRQMAATCDGRARRSQTGKSGTTTQIIALLARRACAHELLR